MTTLPFPPVLPFRATLLREREREREIGREREGQRGDLPTMLSQASLPLPLPYPVALLSGSGICWPWPLGGLSLDVAKVRQSQCTSELILVTKGLSFQTSTWFSGFHGPPSFSGKRGQNMLLPRFTSSNRWHRLNNHIVFEKRKTKFSLPEVMREIPQRDKDGTFCRCFCCKQTYNLFAP